MQFYTEKKLDVLTFEILFFCSADYNTFLFKEKIRNNSRNLTIWDLNSSRKYLYDVFFFFCVLTSYGQVKKCIFAFTVKMFKEDNIRFTELVKLRYVKYELLSNH